MTDSLSDQDRHAIDTLYRVFAEGNPELLDEALTPDWQDIPLAPDQAPGSAGMKPMIVHFAEVFTDRSVIIHELIGAPGRGAVRGEITATHSGEWFGLPATGKRIVLRIHDFHHVEQGRITHTWHLEDWFGWANQVGGRLVP